MRMIFLLIFWISMIGFVFAETTFFEGEEGLGFLINEMSNETNVSIFCGNSICDFGENCTSCMGDCGVCDSNQSVFATELNESFIYEIISGYFPNNSFDYLEEDLSLILNEINGKSTVKISKEKAEEYIMNYKEFSQKGITGFTVLSEENRKYFFIGISLFTIIFSIFFIIFRRMKKK